MSTRAGWMSFSAVTKKITKLNFVTGAEKVFGKLAKYSICYEVGKN